MARPDIEKSTPELAIELETLRMKSFEGYLTEERRAQIRQRIGAVGFELSQRPDYRYGQDPEQGELF